MEKTNIYKKARKSLSLSRAEAAELTFMAEKRIERIETGEISPNPQDVISMSKAYNNFDLCNYYCSRECAIGMEFMSASPISDKSLTDISMSMLSELNNINKKRNMIIDTTADGKITEDEYNDFKAIYNNLEQLEITIQSLKLWLKENMNNVDF